MPFLVLVALFIGIPILEISVLIKVTAAIGGGKTILFVIFTAVLGAHLVKQQGLAIVAKFNQEMNAGRLPAQQMLEGVLLLFAGAVLLTPGFITDALGFALLIPWLRQTLITYLIKSGKIVGVAQGASAHPNSGFSAQGNNDANSTGSVIEGEFSTDSDEPK